MNRQEIKELAKTKIKGNIWNLLWPFLCITVISGIGSRLGGGTTTYDAATMKFTTTTSPTGTAISFLFTILSALVTAGYIKYVLSFVRTGKMDANDIINTIKEKWLNLLIAYLVGGFIIIVCSLLIIPGIIMGLAYSFITYLIIDSDISGIDSLKKSREMMKGYKMDYFVFMLSFLGWFVLSIFTCCILFIWVIPYFYVANSIYYEKLKENTK